MGPKLEKTTVFFILLRNKTRNHQLNYDKMKKTFLFALTLAVLFAVPIGCYAQIEEEILQSKSTKIEKGRAFLLEKFMERDYEKVTEAKDYLLSLEDEHYVAIAPMELCHILMWTREFDALTAYMRQIDSSFDANMNKKIRPGYDELSMQLFQRSTEDEHLLRFNVEEANLSVEDKAFLTLYLDWFVTPNTYKIQSELDDKSEAFLKNYPDSDYKWFVQHVISTQAIQAQRGNWGWGIGLDLCGGFVTGKLSETMTPIVGLGLSFALAYKKLLMELGYDIVLSKTKVDQPISTGVYEAGHNNTLFNFYLDASYPVFSCKVFSGRKLIVSPVLGVGGCWETYGDKNLSYEEVEELDKFYPTVRAGLLLSIKSPGVLQTGSFGIKYHCGLSNFGGNISAIHMISIGGSGLIY